MFFYLSKIVWFFLQPSGFFLVLLGFCIILFALQKTIFAKRLLSVLFVYYLTMAYLPLGSALIVPLENRIERPDLSQIEDVDGIIVLGGAENPWVTNKRGTFTFYSSGERFSESVIMARQFPDAKILFSGGLWFSMDQETRNEGPITDFYVNSGIDKSRIMVEGDSRNTNENALFSKERLNPQPGEKWLLVTSAFHMPRALGCFQQVGFDVIPVPVDYRTRGYEELTVLEYYARDGIDKTDLATKEYLGLLIYWITGRIPTLFPK